MRWWHEKRQADAEQNARLYGWTAPDIGPRMTRERMKSGTLSREGITAALWGIPPHVTTVIGDVRDLCRRLLVSPFTVWKWSRQGMPTLYYYPWRRYDWKLVVDWLAKNVEEVPREVTIEEVDDLQRFVLAEVQAGRGSVDDAREILLSQ